MSALSRKLLELEVIDNLVLEPSPGWFDRLNISRDADRRTISLALLQHGIHPHYQVAFKPGFTRLDSDLPELTPATFKQMRIGCGLSLQQTAAILGLSSKGTVQGYEKDSARQMPGQSTWALMLLFCGTHPAAELAPVGSK